MFPNFSNGYGVVLAEGDRWRDHHRFIPHTFRNLGLGRKTIEGRIREEINYACENIDVKIAESPSGKAVMNPSEISDILVGSIINRMILGYRFDGVYFFFFLLLGLQFSKIYFCFD